MAAKPTRAEKKTSPELFAMILLLDHEGMIPGTKIMVDSSTRGRYLLSTSTGPGPVAQDYKPKGDDHAEGK